MEYNITLEQLDVHNQLLLIRKRIVTLIKATHLQSEKALTAQEKEFFIQSRLSLDMALDAINDAILFTQP